MRQRRARPIVVVGLVVASALGVLVPSVPAGAFTTFTVTTTDDVTNGGDGVLSLREALDAADGDGDASQIVLAAGATYELDDCSGPGAGLLATTANEDLEIDGNGATIRQTCPTAGVLNYGSDGTLLVDGVTITGGRCSIAACIAGGVGVSQGESILVITNSVIADNRTTDSSGGGGVFGFTLGTTLTNVVLRDNQANVGGSAVRSTGPLSITDSAVYGNSSPSGAAIFHDKTLNLTNSTVVDNESGDLTASAVYGNGAGDETSAIYDSVTILGNDGPQITERWAQFANTVIAEPDGFPNCNHPSTNTIISGAHNWLDDESCGLDHPTDVEDGDDPMLRPLFRNGGFAPSLYPEKGSPLLDLVPADSIISVDQRGVTRPQNDLGDVGSIEVEVCHALFTDVVSDNPLCWEIGWLSGSGVTTGFPDGSFGPSDAVTRGSMAAFMYRLMGSPRGADPACASAAFPDVATSHPFCGEIDWLVDEGVTGGFLDGTYRPGDPVTRGSMAAFMYRLAGSPGGPDPACVGDPFPDVPEDHVFCGEIAAIADAGVTTGFPDGTYRPASSVTRQSMAGFMYRLADGIIS